MPADLLKTKLFVPPARPHQVPRHALLEKLATAFHAGVPCVLVSAPAGFGKTTLVSAWARTGGQPCAWLTLDEGDNDPVRFWRYVVAALQTVDSRLGAGVRPALSASQAPVIQPVITELINDLASLDQTISLVLEDYHVLQQPDLHASLNYLLDHQPPQMRLVIVTRSDPPLNLARRRGRGQLAEIRAGDLRFTPAETHHFLNQLMQLGLSEADLAALDQRTEGWAAGLQLLALSMQDEADRHAFVANLGGGDRYIADYLMEEVLQRQLVELQDFLLRTSILDRLSAPLCDAVTGRADSRAMLNLLERTNLFLLPLDSHREWFRYHHLFAELLRQRLRDAHPAEAVAGLHRAACAWHEAQGNLFAALHHARAIPDERRVLQLLEGHAVGLLLRGELPLLYEAAGQLPADLRHESPFLCISVAWAGLGAGRLAEVPAWLAAIEAHFGLPATAALTDPTLDHQRRAALLEVLVIRLHVPPAQSAAEHRAHVLAIRDQLEALPPEQIGLLNPILNLKLVIAFNLGLVAEAAGDLALAARTHAEAAALARQTFNGTLFHMTMAHLANCHLAQGRLRAAQQTHEQALAEAPDFGPDISPSSALSQAGLGALHYEWNDLAAAERYFAAGLERARMWNLWEALTPIALGQAQLKLRLGDPPAALALLEGFKLPPQAGAELPLQARAALIRARSGQPDAAAAWLAANFASPLPAPTPANEAHLLEVARLLIALHRPAAASALAAQLARFAQDGQRGHTHVQAQVLLAVALAAADQPAAAGESFQAALRLGAEENYCATFVDEGEPIRGLLDQALRQRQLPPPLAAYARRLQAALAPAARPAQALAEPLSDRELEVLRFMNAGLTNPEIASRLFLSPNTLKAHAQNIFAKLAVHSRLQAVNKAKDLGLIA